MDRPPATDLADVRARNRTARALGLVIVLAAALLASLVTWAALAEIDVRVAARGRLVNLTQNVVLRPLEAGVLRDLAVRPGQVVRKGEIIATLDPTFAGADLSQLSVRELSLRAQVERLREQAGDTRTAQRAALNQVGEQRRLLVDQQAFYAARLKQLDERLARLKVDRQSALADQKVLAERVRALQDLESMSETLANENLGSRARTLEARERRLEAERDLTLARNRQAEAERDIVLAEAGRAAFIAENRQQVREELARAARDSAEAGELLQKARRRTELVTLSAPQDAVVLEVRQTSPGSILNPSEVFAVLVPLGAELQAEIDVPPIDVGEIRVGDAVRLKVDAFPFQRHGILGGKVTTISGDAFTQPASDPTRPPVSYRVRAVLDSTVFSQSAQAHELLPGMTLTGEVVVGRRTVLSYFLYPLIRVMDESIRER